LKKAKKSLVYRFNYPLRQGSAKGRKRETGGRGVAELQGRGGGKGRRGKGGSWEKSHPLRKRRFFKLIFLGELES